MKPEMEIIEFDVNLVATVEASEYPSWDDDFVYPQS